MKVTSYKDYNAFKFGETPPKEALERYKQGLVFLNGYALPGIATIPGIVFRYNYRPTQEQRSFITRIYFSGIEVPKITLNMLIWSQAQYDAGLELATIFAPHPVESLPDLGSYTIANPVVNEARIYSVSVMSWQLFGTPTPGEFFGYTVELLQSYPKAFIPAPPKKDKDNAHVVDAKQSELRAINPDKSLEEKANKAAARYK